MENTILTTHEIIDAKILSINEKATGYFNNLDNSVFTSKRVADAGFIHTPNAQAGQTVDAVEFERAKISRHFGKVITDMEVHNICRMYKLTLGYASEFKDTIPDKNVQDILNFIEKSRTEQWNLGRSVTDLYYMPLGTQFEVVAPLELFSQKLLWDRMKKEDYARWLKEDPIILKKVYKFDPFAKNQGEPSNIATQFNVVVTAWGFEAMLLDGNNASMN